MMQKISFESVLGSGTPNEATLLEFNAALAEHYTALAGLAVKSAVRVPERVACPRHDVLALNDALLADVENLSKLLGDKAPGFTWKPGSKTATPQGQSRPAGSEPTLTAKCLAAKSASNERSGTSHASLAGKNLTDLCLQSRGISREQWQAKRQHSQAAAGPEDSANVDSY